MSENNSEGRGSEGPPPRIFYDLFARVGNKGRYQTLALLIILINCIISVATFFVNPYLFYQKNYNCHGVVSSRCTNHVCSLPPSQRGPY